jgi:methyltransferase (TIGR00027 family)
VGRALHLSTAHQRLIEDHLALDLSGPAGAALMAQLTTQTSPEALEGLSLAFALRARFVEDVVARAASAGVSQYVILGAGLDTFAHRRSDLAGRLRVFEVDRPAAQAWKRARLEELRVTAPEELVYVPVDFEAGDLGTELSRDGFDPTAASVVSWIAVSQYLGRGAIDRTLGWAAHLPTGSRLVLTYVVPPDQLSELAQAGLAWTRSQAEARGEPFLSLFRPDEIAATLRDAGFGEVEQVEAEALRRRYLRDWPDAPLTGIERLAVATV